MAKLDPLCRPDGCETDDLLQQCSSAFVRNANVHGVAAHDPQRAAATSPVVRSAP